MGGDSLPARLFHRARQAAPEPWLFYRPALDWRWRSLAAMAHQVRRGAEELARQLGERSPGSPRVRVAFPDDLSPESVALFLAAQAAGTDAVAVAPGEPPEPPPGVMLWLTTPEVSSRSRPSPWKDVPALELPAAPGALERASRRTVGEGPSPGSEAQDHPAGPDPRDLLEAAEAVSTALGPPPEAAPDILVLGRPLAQLAGRTLLAWSLTAPAVVLLEPEPPAFVETVRWARPTVVAATATELSLLAEDLFEVPSRRWWRSRLGPLDRVRAVLVYGAEALEEDLSQGFQEHGAKVLDLARVLGASEA